MDVSDLIERWTKKIIPLIAFSRHEIDKSFKRPARSRKQDQNSRLPIQAPGRLLLFPGKPSGLSYVWLGLQPRTRSDNLTPEGKMSSFLCDSPPTCMPACLAVPARFEFCWRLVFPGFSATRLVV
jgi:hypothetical protein